MTAFGPYLNQARGWALSVLSMDGIQMEEDPVGAEPHAELDTSALIRDINEILGGFSTSLNKAQAHAVENTAMKAALGKSQAAMEELKAANRRKRLRRRVCVCCAVCLAILAQAWMCVVCTCFGIYLASSHHYKSMVESYNSPETWPPFPEEWQPVGFGPGRVEEGTAVPANITYQPTHADFDPWMVTAVLANITYQPTHAEFDPGVTSINSQATNDHVGNQITEQASVMGSLVFSLVATSLSGLTVLFVVSMLSQSPVEPDDFELLSPSHRMSVPQATLAQAFTLFVNNAGDALYSLWEVVGSFPVETFMA